MNAVRVIEIPESAEVRTREDVMRSWVEADRERARRQTPEERAKSRRHWPLTCLRALEDLGFVTDVEAACIRKRIDRALPLIEGC